MAKRKPSQGKNPHRRASAQKKSVPKKRPTRKPVRRKPAPKKRPATKAAATKKTLTKKTATVETATTRAANTPKRPRARAGVGKSPRLDRQRRTLDEGTLRTPPSSLDMTRHGTAVGSGRAEIEKHRIEHQGMPPSITAGDVDVNVENAYFTGDEAPGGDNPPPDMDVVDEIGKALGVQYGDNEELRGSDKVSERDKHRWEMDPASAEDYKDRK